MTNSVRETHKQTIGTEDQTSQDRAKFVSNKGTEFETAQTQDGMWVIKMKRGGVAPSICNEKFTGQFLAERALTSYLRKTDRGYAQYPEKGKNDQSQD
jgi:hypothetical protein